MNIELLDIPKINDISKIDNDFLKLKQLNTSLVSLSFVYKL